MFAGVVEASHVQVILVPVLVRCFLVISSDRDDHGAAPVARMVEVVTVEEVGVEQSRHVRPFASGPQQWPQSGDPDNDFSCLAVTDPTVDGATANSSVSACPKKMIVNQSS